MAFKMMDPETRLKLLDGVDDVLAPFAKNVSIPDCPKCDAGAMTAQRPRDVTSRLVPGFDYKCTGCGAMLTNAGILM